MSLASLVFLQLVIVEPEAEPGPAGPPPIKLVVSALVQVEAGARPDPGDVPGFRLARARLSVDGKLEKTLAIEGFVEIEASPTSRLLEPPLADAWLGLDVATRALADLGRLRLGQLKVPFGGELARPPPALMFIDRAAPLLCLAPGRQQFGSGTSLTLGDSTGRDVGLRWDGAFGPLHLGAGVWNGEGPNRVRAPDPEPHAGPLVTARAALELGPDLPARAHLVAGASFARGDAAPLAACAGGIGVRRADATWGAGDFYFRWKWVRAEAEYVYQNADFDRWGLSGAAGFYAIPDFLLVAFRAERVPDFWQWTAGLALAYFGDRLRLQYGFTRRTHAGDGLTTSAHLIAFTLAL
ncbi:MAG TPA: hypothetical protein VKN99_13870 [Polyangia bacterium]|nr:hypothetical protein [Polyangia bacterium]